MDSRPGEATLSMKPSDFNKYLKQLSESIRTLQGQQRQTQVALTTLDDQNTAFRTELDAIQTQNDRSKTTNESTSERLRKVERVLFETRRDALHQRTCKSMNDIMEHQLARVLVANLGQIRVDQFKTAKNIGRAFKYAKSSHEVSTKPRTLFDTCAI